MILPEGATDLRDAIARGDISAVEAARQTLGRIAAVDPAVHAFLHVNAEAVLAEAAGLDRESDRSAPLFGVPIAVKDNICVNGVPTTAGSRTLDGYRPPYDATVIERLRRAGAVLIGKTNCDEFAMGSSTEHSAFGPTHNPWALDRSPGGSSGGSAAAVAAGLAPLALGSETGGSVRQPAALCGIVGLKPTYGRISRYGLIAFASSLDQIGPMGGSCRDVALLLGVIAGHDVRDATSATEPVADYAAALTGDLTGVRIGVPRHLLEEGVEPGVAAAFADGLVRLTDAGAVIVDIQLHHAALAIPVYALVAYAEASSNLSRFDGVRYGPRAGTESVAAMYEATRAAFGAEVKRRIMIGTFILSAGYYDAYYVKAQQVRGLIAADYDRAFETVRLIATPTSPTVAFPLGSRVADPIAMYLSDVFTAPANLAGVPAISVPCGAGESGLPVGLQLTAPKFAEALLLRAAEAVERRTAKRRPPAAASAR